jgi:hypothetical protein
MPLTDEERRKIARAIWHYTGMTNDALEDALGWRRKRLKEMARDPNKSAPSLDELVAMAEYAGVPTAFAIDGWAAADPLAHLEEQISDLRAAHRALTAQVARQAQEMRELRGQDLREEPSGD